MEQDINIPLLRNFKFIHSIILFGSRARGREGESSDIDLCIIPKPGISVNLRDRIALENLVPQDVDISLFDDLPVNIRNSVLHEGKVLHTDDLYYVLTLAKENDLEYAGYKHRRGIYHDIVMERVREHLGG
ncbi:MAG: nucleotidyltransferase domain-containing protein [Methanosarcinaceae archaeon]|nr:nucleotidyltransferase domain-containing protein [Methanosarcinaceae archaeon]